MLTGEEDRVMKRKRDWKSIVRTLAPTIAQTLGGPLAGMAVNALSTELLGHGDGTVSEIAQVVQAGNPEMFAKLKAAELRHVETLKRLDIDIEEIHARDRDSARRREMALKDRTPMILAAGVFVGFFGILVALIFVTIPEGSLSPLNIMLGSLGTIVVQVAAYYFGSSDSSSRKNEILAGLLKRGG